MNTLGARRKRAEPDVEINMVPIMNMFLVLIPFLLMSSSFLHLRAIDTSVPVRSATQPGEQQDTRSDIVVTAVIKLTERSLMVSITSDELDEAKLQVHDSTITRKNPNLDDPLKQLSNALKAIKEQYPKSKTLILSPSDNILYEEMVAVMDAARRTGDHPLFPIVVVSGEVSAG